MFTSVTQCELVLIPKFKPFYLQFTPYPYIITFSFYTITLSKTMTHPNIVYTPHQRIDQGNINSYTGPIPTRYSKYGFLFHNLHLDTSQLIYNAS